MAQKSSKKVLTKAIVDVSRGGGVLEVVLPRRGHMTYLRKERLCLGD